MYILVGANLYLFTCKWPKWICTLKDYRYFIVWRHFWGKSNLKSIVTSQSMTCIWRYIHGVVPHLSSTLVLHLTVVHGPLRKCWTINYGPLVVLIYAELRQPKSIRFVSLFHYFYPFMVRILFGLVQLYLFSFFNRIKLVLNCIMGSSLTSCTGA